jgi:hypothetical protein
MFAFVVLCNVSVFGQEIEKKKSIISNTTEIVSEVKKSTSSSNMDFVLWFMVQTRPQ